jgi:hypothetical protein
MQQTTALPTHHADLVTDVAYDYYGERREYETASFPSNNSGYHL